MNIKKRTKWEFVFLGMSLLFLLFMVILYHKEITILDLLTFELLIASGFFLIMKISIKVYFWNIHRVFLQYEKEVNKLHKDIFGEDYKDEKNK